MNGLKTRRLAFYPKQGNKIEGVVLTGYAFQKFIFGSKDQLTKKRDRILLRHLISNNWKYRTKEARLILQSGMYISFMYFRNFLSQTGSGFQPPAAHLYPNIGRVSPPVIVLFFIYLFFYKTLYINVVILSLTKKYQNAEKQVETYVKLLPKPHAILTQSDSKSESY